jgi:hypothetical protein
VYPSPSAAETFRPPKPLPECGSGQSDAHPFNSGRRCVIKVTSRATPAVRRESRRDAVRVSGEKRKAGEGTRTLDIQLGKLALYQLSYAREPFPPYHIFLRLHLRRPAESPTLRAGGGKIVAIETGFMTGPHAATTRSDFMPEPQPHPVPATQPVPKRFFGPLAWTTLLTAVAAVLLGAAALPWFLSDPARVSTLIARAAPGLQADVSIGRASIGWSSPVVIEDVRIVPRNGARSPLAIKRIEGSHGLAAMLLSGGDLGRYRVDGLAADVVFNTDRTSNLTGLFEPVAPVGGDGGEAPPRRSPVRVRFDIDDAIATITGPWAPESWVSEPTDIKVALGPLADGSASAWTVDKVQLLRDARLEPNVAQGVLAYIAPVMADAARTGGRFSLRLDGATFPVGAPEAARLSGVLSMHEVDMGPGPLTAKMLDALPGRLDLPRSIRVADDSEVEFHLANRRVWHKGLEFGIPLAKPGQRLDINSSGSVGLDDKSLDLKFALPVPADLPADRPLLASLAGKSISLGIGGVLGEPKVNFDGSIRATAGNVVADLVDRLRNPRQPLPPRPAQAPAPKWVPPRVEEPAVEAPQADAKSPPDSAAAKAKDGKDDSVPRSPANTAERLDELKSKLPGDIANDPSAAAVIDLVGGVLDEVAKRRAERATANADNPQAAPPPGPRRGGRLLRRLTQPPTSSPSDAEK